MWKEFISLENVGTREGGIRLGAGAVALLWGITGGGLLIALLGVIGIVTGYYNSCQIYKLMGRNTNTNATAAPAAEATQAAAAAPAAAATAAAASAAAPSTGATPIHGDKAETGKATQTAEGAKTPESVD